MDKAWMLEALADIERVWEGAPERPDGRRPWLTKDSGMGVTVQRKTGVAVNHKKVTPAKGG